MAEDAADARITAPITLAQRPGQETVRGIAEEHLVGVGADPFRAQPTGEVSAQGQEDSHCTTISQMPAPMVKVAAEAPALCHGEIAARPSPAANDTRTSAVAIAIKAPENIAAQLTAE